jgi:fermentation-respiration switch protein FrsA (DUF1100 family)
MKKGLYLGFAPADYFPLEPPWANGDIASCRHLEKQMTFPSKFDRPPANVTRRPMWKQILRRIVLLILIPYAVIVVMFTLLQRTFIYLPTREAHIKPADAGLPFGQAHDIRVDTADGLELHGWHVLPDGRSAADRAESDGELEAGRTLALYFSGNAANRRYRTHELQVLTGLGCHVFVFDYRGYGDNGGSPSEESLASDARAIWDYATQQRKVAPQRIVLYGESLGGSVAVRLAAAMCDAETPPAGIILRSTFSSLVDVGKYHYPWLPVQSLLVDRFPSIDLISAVNCPILQVHGARDRIVPIELGRRLFDAAPNRSSGGLPKRLVGLPTAGHNDVLLVAEENLRRAVREFLESL